MIGIGDTEKIYVLPRISYFHTMMDIYTMKETIFIEENEKEQHAAPLFARPAVIVVTVSVILVLLLNLVNTLFFS